MTDYSNIEKPTTPYEEIDKFVPEEGYLLLEDGGYLLNEDGSKIRLNYPGGYDNIYPEETIYTNINKPS